MTENVDSDDNANEVQDSIIWKPLGGSDRDDAFNLSGKLRRGTLAPEEINKINKKKTYLVQFDDKAIDIESEEEHVHIPKSHQHHGEEHKAKKDRKRITKMLKDRDSEIKNEGEWKKSIGTVIQVDDCS